MHYYTLKYISNYFTKLSLNVPIFEETYNRNEHLHSVISRGDLNKTLKFKLDHIQHVSDYHVYSNGKCIEEVSLYLSYSQGKYINNKMTLEEGQYLNLDKPLLTDSSINNNIILGTDSSDIKFLENVINKYSKSYRSDIVEGLIKKKLNYAETLVNCLKDGSFYKINERFCNELIKLEGNEYLSTGKFILNYFIDK